LPPPPKAELGRRRRRTCKRLFLLVKVTFVS
jgi:hypothetical protein